MYLTYRIGVDGKAEVIKIGATKKARIKVKGVKGKTRDKIKKAIKRQTNANVM